MLRTLLKLSGLIASSWALSWCLYRLHGIRLIGPPHEEIWYFAYGANMHDSAFRQWRGMRPSDWRPGRVRGYRLRFNLAGPPRGRAIYANLCVDPAAEVWGSFTRSRAATSFVWAPRKEFRGGGIGRFGSLQRTSAARRCRSRPTLPKAMNTTTTHRSATSRCCGRALERTACLSTTFGFWRG